MVHLESSGDPTTVAYVDDNIYSLSHRYPHRHQPNYTHIAMIIPPSPSAKLYTSSLLYVYNLADGDGELSLLYVYNLADGDGGIIIAICV